MLGVGGPVAEQVFPCHLPPGKYHVHKAGAPLGQDAHPQCLCVCRPFSRSASPFLNPSFSWRNQLKFKRGMGKAGRQGEPATAPSQSQPLPRQRDVLPKHCSQKVNKHPGGGSLSGRMRVTGDGCLDSLCNTKKHLSCSILTGETSGPPVSPRLGVSALFNANVPPW